MVIYELLNNTIIVSKSDEDGFWSETNRFYIGGKSLKFFIRKHKGYVYNGLTGELIG